MDAFGKILSLQVRAFMTFPHRTAEIYNPTQ